MRFPPLPPASFVALSMLSAAPVAAQTCTPEWSEMFPTPAGLNGRVMVPWDPDGSGPQPEALYLGMPGGFQRWDGRLRVTLATVFRPAFPNYGEVLAMTPFDPDGPGPAPTELVVAGNFNAVDDGISTTPANNIVRWNGSTWSALGSGTNDIVGSLFVFDEDAGGPNPPRLFAGGNFISAGGVTAHGIARWDGSSWTAVASVTGFVSVGALAAFDADGAGPGVPVLVASGFFPTIGGVTVNHIARWNGTSWAAFGAGGFGAISPLAEFDADGAGPQLPRLFAAGAVLPGSQLASWNGTTWSGAGNFTNAGSSSVVLALHVHDDDGAGPGAPALYAAGEFDALNASTARGIARWDGAVWSEPGGGVQESPAICCPTARCLASYDDDGSSGAPARLYVGGFFGRAGGLPAEGLARWDGSAWLGMQRGLDNAGSSLAVADLDGGGPATPALYIGGGFEFADGVQAIGVVRWDGATWSPLGSGLSGSGGNGGAEAIVEFDEDAGGPNPPRLFVGGQFDTAGGVPAANIGRWDGSSWSDVGGGVAGGFPSVRALAVFDEDGPGPGAPALFAGGFFDTAGGSPAASIARWDGSTWSALGSGVGGPGGGLIEALVVADLGTGAKLYAGGYFSLAGGVPANYIASWDGANWTALGSGMSLGPSPVVLSLYADDLDGPGPGPMRLYAGGGFLRAGGILVNRVAAWDGSTWSALGGGINAFASGGFYVYSLATLDPSGAGTGTKALFAGGSFYQTQGGVDYWGLARWDGSSWGNVGSLPSAGGTGTVTALAVFDEDGGGPVRAGLYATGDFISAAGISSERIGRFGCPVNPPTSFCFGDGSGTPCPCGNPGLTGRGCNNYGSTTGGALLTASGQALLSGDSFTLHATGENTTSLTVYWTGTNLVSPAGVAHGAGLRCVNGLNRLYSGSASAGAISRPGVLDASVSARSAAVGVPIVAGQTRYYFTIYRDPQAATPCANTASTVNLSNGVGVQWYP